MLSIAKYFPAETHSKSIFANFVQSAAFKMNLIFCHWQTSFIWDSYVAYESSQWVYYSVALTGCARILSKPDHNSRWETLNPSRPAIKVVVVSLFFAILSSYVTLQTCICAQKRPLWIIRVCGSWIAPTRLSSLTDTDSDRSTIGHAAKLKI